MVHGARLTIAILFATCPLGLPARGQAPPPLPLPLPPIANIFQGTPQEQAACRPDATKMCREYLADNMRVLTCLQANRARISVACRTVLESHGQ
jgi:hypothetical protein